MKLKEYLQGFKGLNRDLEVVFASDDEGNSFNKVVFLPAEGAFDAERNIFTDKGSLDDHREINSVCIN